MALRYRELAHQAKAPYRYGIAGLDLGRFRPPYNPVGKISDRKKYFSHREGQFSIFKWPTLAKGRGAYWSRTSG